MAMALCQRSLGDGQPLVPLSTACVRSVGRGECRGGTGFRGGTGGADVGVEPWPNDVPVSTKDTDEPTPSPNSGNSGSVKVQLKV